MFTSFLFERRSMHEAFVPPFDMDQIVTKYA